jgi:two-component system response regulator YesN
MNILVVEDELLALDDLLAMLQPFADAHMITGCASGAEALACAAATPPDLLITDIRMPELDGLELVRQLKTSVPQLAAIVLSGYSEFEYARMSLRLGISDYLLKPVRTDALHQTVARALNTLAEERARATHLREALLVRLLLGGRRSAIAEPNLLAGDWGVIFMICQNWESPLVWRDTPIDRNFIVRTLALEGPRPCDIVDLDGRCRVVLIPLAGPQLHLLDILALRLHRAILAAGIVAHTTYVYKGADQRPERVVPEGLHRLTQTMRFAAPTFVRPGSALEEMAGAAPRQHTQLVLHFLAEGKLPAAIAEVYAVLDQFQRAGALQSTIIQTLDELFGLIQQHTKSVTTEPLPNREALTAIVRASQTYDELAAWVEVQLQPLLKYQHRAATPRQLVRALVALLHTAYADDLSLQAFAAEHNVSLAYFSRLFKLEVGATFSDYLTQVRVEKAKELLTHRNLRLSDISTLVGYDDPKYFSQIFRKVAGVSPLDYQRSRHRDGYG